jgi:hypothetical protein
MQRDRATVDKNVIRYSKERRLRFENYFVHIAPHPVFAWLDGLYDRMLGCVKMLGSVFVFGGIAATDMATLAAKPQVDPAVTHLEALFAALAMRLNFLDVTAVRTDWAHTPSFVASRNSSG